MYFAPQKTCNLQATDEHFPWLHISFKICCQLYCEYIPDVRYVERCFSALVDFVEIIEIFRSLAFTVHLRHLEEGIELTQSVSPAQVANSL
jgi:hypothetical protein